MKWLYLDTHESGVLRYGVIKTTGKPALRTINGRGQKLLPVISKHLSEINGIICVEGPGAFSAIRTGVLDANLLSRLLKVPLYGITYQGEETFQRSIEAIRGGELQPVSYLAPIYDAEPNITIKTNP